MKPRIVCHMETSLDGRLHPSRFTDPADGARGAWPRLYEAIHDELGGGAWMVGRTTMAEMSKAKAHPPTRFDAPSRRQHIARADAKTLAIALDRSGRLHFEAGGEVGGDPAVVLLGQDVADAHLAELVADGVSYLVADDEGFALPPLMERLGEAFGLRQILLEGGGRINGALLAQGLVDEISLLVLPGIDGDEGIEGVFTFPGGLKGRLKLRLLSAQPRDGGAVHLRYAVERP